MELKDVLALVIALLSACVYVYAAFIARQSVHYMRHTQKWLANHQLLDRAREMVIENPDLLRMHGISLDELSKDGVSPQEFLYIEAQLDAASALSNIGGDHVVELTEFRKRFLENPKVQIVWKKYLRGRMFNVTPFSKAVDECIAQHDA